MFGFCCGFYDEQTSSVKNPMADNEIVPVEIYEEYGRPKITHKGYKSWDLAQQIVQYAYDYTSWDMNFIYLLECESGMKPTNVWDSGKAYGLCQMNSNYHKIPQAYYDDWGYQVEYCYSKYKTGTKFYGPSRKIKGQRCSDYVKDRFLIQ